MSSPTDAGDVRRLRFLVELAESTLAANPPDAAHLGEQAAELARSLDQPALLGRALFVLVQAHRSDATSPLAVLEELLGVIDHLRAGAVPLTLARALVLLGRLQGRLSDYVSSIASFQEAQRLAREEGDAALDAQASFGMAVSLQASSPRHADRFEAQLLDTEAKARALGDESLEALAAYNLAVGYRTMGQLERARPKFEQALALARSIDRSTLVIDCWSNVALVAAATGLPTEARIALEHAEGLVGSNMDDEVVAGVELVRAHVALAHGKVDEAIAAVARASAVRSGPGTAAWQAECELLRVECLERGGNVDGALAAHRRFHELSEQARDEQDASRLSALEVVNRTDLARREAEQQRRAREQLEVQAAERERELNDELALMIAHRRVVEERLVDDPLAGLGGPEEFARSLSPELARNGAIAVAHLVLDRVALADRASVPIDQVAAELTTRLRAIALTDPRLVLGRRSIDFLVAALGAGDDPLVRLQALVDRLRQPVTVSGVELVPPLSGGVVVAPGDGRVAEELIERAHLAARSTRPQRREVLRRFEPALEDRLGLRRFIEAELHDALGADALELFYQPEIECRSGETVGAEALLRWRHPTRGDIPPGTFIPIAEESDLIVEVGRWVLRSACEQAHQWRDIPRLVVSVNVSAAQVLSGSVIDHLRSAIDAVGLARGRLAIELTESLFVGDSRAVITVLEEVRRLGVAVVLDDFGTGYSSLSYLSSLPLDGVKTDRSFVADVDRQPARAALTQAMVTMAHSLGLFAVAEGVERQAELEVLTRQGYDVYQGWLASPAVRADRLEASFGARRLSAT